MLLYEKELLISHQYKDNFPELLGCALPICMVKIEKPACIIEWTQEVDVHFKHLRKSCQWNFDIIDCSILVSKQIRTGSVLYLYATLKNFKFSTTH